MVIPGFGYGIFLFLCFLKSVNRFLLKGYGMEDGAFCGVFDGHGKNGHVASKIVRNRLPSLILSQKHALSNNKAAAANNRNFQIDREDAEMEPSNEFYKWKEACVSAFKVMDKEVKLQENLDCSCSGTTAVVVIRQVIIILV